MDLWSSADVEGIGRISINKLQRILKLKEDDELMEKLKEEVGERKLDFYDYAKLALVQTKGIYVDRPSWAKKKDLDAAQRTFIPAVSAETMQSLLSFVDRHTISAMDAMIENKAAVRGQSAADAEVQTVALKLVVAVLNDLIRSVHLQTLSLYFPELEKIGKHECYLNINIVYIVYIATVTTH